MSEEPRDPLQFEHAEYAGTTPAAACTVCRAAIQDAYWEVGGAVVCERCLRERELAAAQGGRLGRVARAAALGALAGAAGAALWYGVRAATGYEVGLISILVGLGVGLAVRKGSGGRGGRGYQVLAVALTYGAIVSTYVPEIVKLIFEKAKAESTATAASPAPAVASPGTAAGAPAPAGPAVPVATGTAAATTPAAGAAPATTSAPAAATAPAPATTARPGAPAAKIGLGKALLALAVFALVVCVLALVAPFLAGFQNVMGILIIGFGLWEAWRLNKAVPVTITGPHRVGRPGQTAA